jgi:RNA polymerase sigma-32 factor
MLEAAEEQDLARRWRETKDRAALERIITSHLRQVRKIARLFAGYGIPLADLVSVGTIGLMRAADGFDPGLGFRFSTYAAWWIRAEMRQFVFDNWSLVRIARNAANKRLFFKLRHLKAELKLLEDGDLDPAARERIAAALRVPPLAVAEMNERLAGGELSLNATLGESGEEWQNTLPDTTPDPETSFGEQEELAVQRRRLSEAMGRLSDRERAIILERRIRDEPNTLEQLSARYGISRERVRQIETRAVEKLKTYVSGIAVTHRARPGSGMVSAAPAAS